jgi:molecular chaperone GrpE (heat shock protein)
MNKHFEDAQYYLKRAGETAAEGVKEEIEPLADRVKDVAGIEDEPEPSRVDRLREDLEELQERAEGETKEAIGNARERLRFYRD